MFRRTSVLNSKIRILITKDLADSILTVITVQFQDADGIQQIVANAKVIPNMTNISFISYKSMISLSTQPNVWTPGGYVKELITIYLVKHT